MNFQQMQMNLVDYKDQCFPFLGGICNLFVRTPRIRITSVQIAGVHVSLPGQSFFSTKVDEGGQAMAVKPLNFQQMQMNLVLTIRYYRTVVHFHVFHKCKQ